MKVFEKPLLMIICSFVLGYVGMLLPTTRIHYEIVTKITSSTGESTTVSSQVFSGILGENPSLLCFSGIARSSYSSRFTRLPQVWDALGRGLTVAVGSLWVSYLVRRKVPLAKFTLLLVLFFGVLLAGLILLTPDESRCNPNEQYLLISYVPFWPTYALLIIGILFGIRANRLTKDLHFESSRINVGNLQP